MRKFVKEFTLYDVSTIRVGTDEQYEKEKIHIMLRPGVKGHRLKSEAQGKWT